MGSVPQALGFCQCLGFRSTAVWVSLAKLWVIEAAGKVLEPFDGLRILGNMFVWGGLACGSTKLLGGEGGG